MYMGHPSLLVFFKITYFLKIKVFFSTCKLSIRVIKILAKATYRDHFCHLASSSASQKISVTFFSGTAEASFLIFGTEHWYGELYRITHFWMRHVHFLFYTTLNIVDIGKFAHKIISVTFFSGTAEASFLIFGTEHWYGELYRITHFWICGMSTSCLTRLWIFKRKEVGRRHMSSLEDLLVLSLEREREREREDSKVQ